LPRWDVLPVELSRDSTWSPLWSFERPYIIVVIATKRIDRIVLWKNTFINFIIHHRIESNNNR